MKASLIDSMGKIIALSEEEKQFVQSVFKEKNCSKGDFFLREGQVCKEVGFIQQGLVRYFINNDGEEMIYDFGSEGNFVCNYESFLDRSPSNKNIQYVENTVLLSISFDNLQLFYNKVSGGEKFGRIICEHIFVDAIRKITSLYTHQPAQRYLDFVQSYPDLQQRIPQYYVSSFVGVKPQSLSRIRKRLATP
jgi:CRP-like cAMP-binding protein